jgi:cytochrome c5
MKKVLTLSIVSLIVFACSHKTTSTVTKTEEVKTTVATETAAIEKTESATVTNEQFLAGKAVYSAKCGNCHKLKEPSRGNMTQWTKWIDRMAPKAKLTEDEKAQVTAYVSVNAKPN